MLEKTRDHLLNSGIPAAYDYDEAERALSEAVDVTKNIDQCSKQVQLVKRRAAEVAIAIDGLADRAAIELGCSKDDVRQKSLGRARARPR